MPSLTLVPISQMGSRLRSIQWQVPRSHCWYVLWKARTQSHVLWFQALCSLHLSNCLEVLPEALQRVLWSSCHILGMSGKICVMELLLTLKVNVQHQEVALPWQGFASLTTEASSGSSRGWAFIAVCYSSLNTLNFSKAGFFPLGSGWLYLLWELQSCWCPAHWETPHSVTL